MKNAFLAMSAKVIGDTGEKQLLTEEEFLLLISQECRRAERSKQKFILALIDGTVVSSPNASAIISPIGAITRETDALGWFAGATLGVLFTELGGAKPEAALNTVVKKVEHALRQAGCGEQLAVSAYILPRDLNAQGEGEIEDGRLTHIHREPKSARSKELQLRIKRAVDVIGSVTLLTLLFPFMLAIAIAVKCSSPGPILFRQTRVGQRGKPFTFLKFRTMTMGNDSGPHQDYVEAFIRGSAVRNTNEKGEHVFKLTRDPRVTPVGKFLRRASLDEVPQFWNVLRGEMSLVGPRPPIPYEVKHYDLWHQRRVLELKPGITGLWQVRGRSRTCFDDMVRLDLQYARTWSPWLDIKILLQTPLAVLGGGGAH